MKLNLNMEEKGKKKRGEVQGSSLYLNKNSNTAI